MHDPMKDLKGQVADAVGNTFVRTANTEERLEAIRLAGKALGAISRMEGALGDLLVHATR